LFLRTASDSSKKRLVVVGGPLIVMAMVLTALIPALSGHEVLAQSSSGFIDANTSAEGDADGLNTKSDELIKSSGGSDSGSGERSSAESKDASVGSRRKLASLLGEVSDVVAKLGDSDQGTLKGHEIRNGIALRARELGNFSTQSNDGALQEVENESILSSQDHLAEQRVLLGSLVAEKKNPAERVQPALIHVPDVRRVMSTNSGIPQRVHLCGMETSQQNAMQIQRLGSVKSKPDKKRETMLGYSDLMCGEPRLERKLSKVAEHADCGSSFQKPPAKVCWLEIYKLCSRNTWQYLSVRIDARFASMQRAEPHPSFVRHLAGLRRCNIAQDRNETVPTSSVCDSSDLILLRLVVRAHPQQQ
ncbi:hypothetical protein KCU61_g669, partial [Aureobasidium melanogenum]